MESVEFVGVHFHKYLTFLWDVIIWVVWVMLNLKYILARMEKVKKKKKKIYPCKNGKIHIEFINCKVPPKFIEPPQILILQFNNAECNLMTGLVL